MRISVELEYSETKFIKRYLMWCRPFRHMALKQFAMWRAAKKGYAWQYQRPVDIHVNGRTIRRPLRVLACMAMLILL
jgi:hypothetical protein